MPLPRALTVPLAGLSAGERVLPEEASRYVARVHRAAVGDALLLVDGARKQEADARVVALENGVRVLITEVRAATRVATRSVTLLQAIGKGDKFDAIVRDATELGVTRIIPVETARTVVRLGGRATERAERWRRVAREAARQSLRGDEPVVDEPLTLDAVLALELGVTIALVPGSLRGLGGLLRETEAGAPLAFLVGPEGGLDPQEIERAVAAGFQTASLGAFVLRTETVAAAVLGALAILGTESP